MFMGATTSDDPAMLTVLPEEMTRTADPVVLKMFFVEDTDDVTEECPSDSERIESVGDDDLVSYGVNNSTASISISSRTTSKFLGMDMTFVGQTRVNHTNAFELPAGTQIVWATREEMTQLLVSQQMPAVVEARLEAQLRMASGDKAVDGALTEKGSRRRRRRRTNCRDDEVNAMAGGGGAMAGGIICCIIFFICCFTIAPAAVGLGGAALKNGACNCFANDDTGRAACALR